MATSRSHPCPLSILSGAPLWVWPLLDFLLFVGWRSVQERDVPLAAIYLLPLPGLLSVNTLTGMANPLGGLAIYAACYAAGASIGYRLQARWIIAKQATSVRLTGEWATMTVILVRFGANFATGSVTVMAPQLYASTPFIAGFAILTGLASGTLGGRALRTATMAEARVAA